MYVGQHDEAEGGVTASTWFSGNANNNANGNSYSHSGSGDCFLCGALAGPDGEPNVPVLAGMFFGTVALVAVVVAIVIRRRKATAHARIPSSDNGHCQEMERLEWQPEQSDQVATAHGTVGAREFDVDEPDRQQLLQGSV